MWPAVQAFHFTAKEIWTLLLAVSVHTLIIFVYTSMTTMSVLIYQTYLNIMLMGYVAAAGSPKIHVLLIVDSTQENLKMFTTTKCPVILYSLV